MSTPHENATVIMRLYELRREAKLREARTWVVQSFNPSSPDDVLAALQSEQGAYLRMVVGYWDMVATFVVHGALDTPMFQATCSEMLAAYSKVEHMIDEVRETIGQPGFFRHVEMVVDEWEGARERMVGIREYFAGLATDGAYPPPRQP